MAAERVERRREAAAEYGWSDDGKPSQKTKQTERLSESSPFHATASSMDSVAAMRDRLDEERDSGSATRVPTVRPQAISDEAVGDLSRDSLGFRPHVDALVRFLRANETQPPLAIAVRAPWGRGKTSFMKMIDHELQRMSSRRLRFATTWFNPWKYSTRDELWAAYLAAVTGCLRDNLGPGRRLWFAIKRFWIGLSEQSQRTAFFWHLAIFAAFLFLSALIVVTLDVGTLTTELLRVVFPESLANAASPALGGTLAWLAAAIPAAAYVMQRFNLDLVQYLKTAATPRTIASLRQFEGQLELLAESKPDHLKVVVFVDDLDRCEPEILWEMVVAQQLAVVSSRCIFVLGMDLDIVARTLSDRLAEHSQEPVERADAFDHGRGYRFLEKIIQTRISIPAYGPEQIQAFVEKLVPASRQSIGRPAAADPPRPPTDELVDDSPELRSAILKYAPAYFTNPRRIKRFVNALRLHVYLAQASGFHAELDELARFLVLTERWPRLVEDLVRHANREHTASETDLPTNPQASERGAWWERWECMEKMYQDVEAPKDVLALLDGIDAGRLQVLCDWYGFRYYGDGQATKLIDPTSPA